jgi:hypothetical protein
MNEIKKTEIKMICADCGKVTGTMNYYGENPPAKIAGWCHRGC